MIGSRIVLRLFTALAYGLILGYGLAAAQTAAAPAPGGRYLLSGPSPSGRWVTPNHDAVIEIAPCGQNLCGRIVGMVLAPNDPIPKDWQGQTQCGLTIIKTAPDTDAAGATVWNGSITDPRDGSVYHARLTPGASHRLLLRGYIGLPVFGRTQSWTPYNGPVTPDCRLPGS